MPNPSSAVQDAIMQMLGQKVGSGQKFEMKQTGPMQIRRESNPPRLLDPQLIDKYLAPLSRQGMDVSGATIPPETDPFGKGGLKGYRMKVTPEGWAPPDSGGGFPLAGLEDIEGRFAITPELAKDPRIMKVLQQYLAAEKMPAPEPPFEINLQKERPDIQMKGGGI